MTRAILFHLYMHMVLARFDFTALFAEKPNFTCSAADDSIHPGQTLYAHQARNVRVADHCRSVLVVVVVAIDVFDTNWKIQAIDASL